MDFGALCKAQNLNQNQQHRHREEFVPLRSDKAYSLIAFNVKTGLRVHISSTTNPKTAWEILQKHFAFVEEGADLMQHITVMISLAEQLRELEEEILSRSLRR